MGPAAPPPADAARPEGSGAPPREANAWRMRLAVARGQLFAFFFFAVFLFLLYQLYRVFSSFLDPIIWAAILAMLFYPLYALVLRAVRGRATVAALTLTLLVTVTIVGPAVSLSSVITREALALVQWVREYVDSGQFREALEQLRASAPGRLLGRLQGRGLEIDYGGLARRAADTAGNVVVAQATAVARNVATFVFHFVLMLFTLFFLFRDGDRMYRALHDLIPMSALHKDAIFLRLYETLSAVMRGMVATAVAQGGLTWLGLWALDLPYAAFLGVVAGFLSLIPMVGPAVVWVPCAIYLAAAGSPGRAVALVAYGALVIGTVDNVLRPLLIGGQTRLPTLFLFFGILGGIQAYGVLGIFLGPVLLAIVVAFVQIYKEQYAAPDGVAEATAPEP
jgi:predicted PurR-regulated permease PerM